MKKNRRQRPARGHPLDSLLDRLMRELYEEQTHWSLQDVAEVFGITRQRAHQRMQRAGAKMRSNLRPGKPFVPAWVLRCIGELRAAGMSAADAAWMFSLNTKTALRSKAPSAHPLGLGKKFPLDIWAPLRSVWGEIENLVLIDAWKDGASMGEIARLLRIPVSEVGVRMSRLRTRGEHIPYRYARRPKNPPARRRRATIGKGVK